MPRIDLNVPFHEKDAAKALGAKWDPQRRVWYVPENVDSSPLSRWIPVLDSPNIRARSYFLAEATRSCWRCSSPTRVFGIILPAGHEVLADNDNASDDDWEVAHEPTLLGYVALLTDPVAAHLSRLAPLYRIDFSQTTQSSYWMNHCERCGAKLGDFDTIEEFGAPLDPITPEDAARVLLREISDPLSSACGSYTCGIEMFDYMRRSR